MLPFGTYRGIYALPVILANTSLPIVGGLVASTYIEVNAVQPEKAEASMLVTLLGIVMVDSAFKLHKA